MTNDSLVTNKVISKPINYRGVNAACPNWNGSHAFNRNHLVLSNRCSRRPVKEAVTLPENTSGRVEVLRIRDSVMFNGQQRRGYGQLFLASSKTSTTLGRQSFACTWALHGRIRESVRSSSSKIKESKCKMVLQCCRGSIDFNTFSWQRHSRSQKAALPAECVKTW